MKRLVFIISLTFWILEAPAQPAPSWYKVMTGKVAQMDATLHLHAAGKKASGYLWFAGTPMVMQCYADYNPSNDSLVVSATINPLTVILTGKLAGNTFDGAASLERENNAAKHAAFKLQASDDSSFTAFDFVYTSANAVMPARLKNESTASFFSAVVWPHGVSNKALDATLKVVINKSINNRNLQKEPGATLVAEKNKFISEWNKTAASLTPAEAKDMGLSYSAEVENWTQVMYEDERVITLANYNYDFSGGAHGNYNTTTTNINKKSGAIIKLGDVLTTPGIQALPALLDAVVRQQYAFDKTKTLEENGLFVKKIVPSDNFYITNGSLGFYYAPYAIMAFAYGEPNLFIPASALAKYIKPEYKKKGTTP